MAKFVNKLKHGTGKYKGKLPMKCFRCGKIGHFATKCTLKNSSGYNSTKTRELNREIYPNKRSLFAEIGSVRKNLIMEEMK